MSGKLIEDEEHFRLFAKTVKNSIAKYGNLPDTDMVELQRGQVNALAALEEEFRLALIEDPNGNDVYNSFLDYILNERKNILVARPYFRERRDFFVSNVFAAIRNRDVEALKQYHLNYHFINLVNGRFLFCRKLAGIIQKIQAARQELVIMNLPLVISRARIFWSRTNKSHMSFMDLCQVGVEGLIAAIDKYGGEYSQSWVGVAIGRIVGNLIESFSSTLLHFYPKDKRKLYIINKYRARHIHGDYELQDLVHTMKEVGMTTDEEEIQELMAASSVVSVDSPPPNEDNDIAVKDSISRYEAPEETRPDVRVEEQELRNSFIVAARGLSLLDKKLLRLKGIDIPLE